MYRSRCAVVYRNAVQQKWIKSNLNRPQLTEKRAALDNENGCLFIVPHLSRIPHSTSTFLIPSGLQLGGITWDPDFSFPGNRLPNVTDILPNRSFRLSEVGECSWKWGGWMFLKNQGLRWVNGFEKWSYRNRRFSTSHPVQGCSSWWRRLPPAFQRILSSSGQRQYGFFLQYQSLSFRFLFSKDFATVEHISVPARCAHWAMSGVAYTHNTVADTYYTLSISISKMFFPGCLRNIKICE